MLRIDPAGFELAAEAGSGGGRLLADALGRLRNTTFAWPGSSAARAAPPPVLLRAMTVAVAAAGEPGYPTARGNESYVLDITLDCARSPCLAVATLNAPQVWGAIRGLQSFSQLVRYNFSDSTYSISTTRIADGPRFQHRAVMIDTARRFYPVATILKVLDAMETTKLNVLQCVRLSFLPSVLVMLRC